MTAIHVYIPYSDHLSAMQSHHFLQDHLVYLTSVKCEQSVGSLESKLFYFIPSHRIIGLFQMNGSLLEVKFSLEQKYRYVLRHIVSLNAVD
jgi:hypothetical protein